MVPVNALDLVGGVITAEDINECEELIRNNFGTDYKFQSEKFKMLWTQIREDGWSNVKLLATTKWFLKNKKWDTWVIADWYEYEQKLNPFSWYLDQIKMYGKEYNRELLCYKINGHCYYCKKSDNIPKLPFEQIDLSWSLDVEKLKIIFIKIHGEPPKDMEKLMNYYDKHGYQATLQVIIGKSKGE